MRYTNKKLLQRVFAFSLAVAFLWQSAACAGGLPYSSLRTQPLVERHAGLIRLQQVRDGLAGLYSYSFDAARVWGVMDLLLGQAEPPAELKEEKNALAEYTATQGYLREHFPDICPDNAQPPVIKVIADGETGGSVATFEITTAEDTYFFSVQTKKIQSHDYVGSPVSFDGAPDQDYRLEEIVTGLCFPWEPPFYYPGKFIRGETDRFGRPLGPDRNGAWMLKPGRNIGDFQFVPPLVPFGELNFKVSPNLNLKLSPALILSALYGFHPKRSFLIKNTFPDNYSIYIVKSH